MIISIIQNGMSPEFKNELDQLQTQLHNKKKASLEDTKLAVAEPDSTIDTALLSQQVIYYIE